MKTILIFILTYFPLLVFSQATANTDLYPIIEEGDKLIQQNQNDEAISLGQKTLKDFPSDLFKQRQAYFIIGRATFQSGDPDAAIAPFRQSFLISKKYDDEPLVLRSLIGLSAAYGEKYNPSNDTARFYLEGAESLALKLRDTISLSKVYSHRSILSFNEGRFAEALTDNELCASILKNTNLEYEKAINGYAKANTLMEIYYNNDSMPLLIEAKEAFLYAINIFHKFNNQLNEAHARNALAGCLFYFEDLGGVEKEANESVRLGLAANNQEVLMNGYYTLSSLYEMQDDEAKLVPVLKNLYALLGKAGDRGDAIFIKEQFANNDVRVSSALIKNKIAYSEKDLENEQLQSTISWGGLIASIILGLAASFIIYFRQKSKIAIQESKIAIQKQKLSEAEQERLEAEQQRLIELHKLQKEEIDNLNKSREIEFIQAKLEGEEKGRHRIAQQIHDGVGGLLISTKWNLEAALKELSQKENKVADRLNENLRLQEHSYLELRRVMYELERTDNKPWWEALQQFCQQLAQHKNVAINYYPYNLDESASGKFGDEIRLAIQELITNALKHANATEIDIQVSQIDGEIDVIVEDNGDGFNKENMKKGIGMRSIETRVNNLGGRYSIETKEGAGTIVFMDIPLKSKNTMEQSIYAGSNN